MTDNDETKTLVNEFSDASRKAVRLGRQGLIPHKFTEQGDIVSDDNFNAKKDLSRLSLNDLRFLSEWRKAKWDDKAASEKLGLSPEQASRLIKKVSYFKTEDAKVKALAEIPTPDWIAAKDVENVYEGGTTNDSQHKSLDRLAKITGAFKSTEINIQQNIFNLPKMTPEAEAAMRLLADVEADKVIDTVAHPI